jgi:TetR/AcrR family transcriptional repressor of mexJK operon
MTMQTSHDILGATMLKGKAKAQSTAKPSLPREGRIARERKAAVLKAAVRVFLKKGLEATSVSDIIAEAGGSKASIYGHFHSKEGLFAAVMRHQIEARGSVFLELTGATSDVEAVLAESGMQFLDLILDDTARALQTIVAHESKKFPELGRLFLEHGPKQVVGPLGNFIRRSHDNGDLVAPDPDMAAWQFILLCQAKYAYPCLIAGMPKPSKLQCQQAIDAAVRTFMAAFGVSSNDRLRKKKSAGNKKSARRSSRYPTAASGE